jgi:hypothetical protein
MTVDFINRWVSIEFRLPFERPASLSKFLWNEQVFDRLSTEVSKPLKRLFDNLSKTVLSL